MGRKRNVAPKRALGVALGLGLAISASLVACGGNVVVDGSGGRAEAGPSPAETIDAAIACRLVHSEDGWQSFETPADIEAMVGKPCSIDSDAGDCWSASGDCRLQCRSEVWVSEGPCD